LKPVAKSPRSSKKKPEDLKKGSTQNHMGAFCLTFWYETEAKKVQLSTRFVAASL